MQKSYLNVAECSPGRRVERLEYLRQWIAAGSYEVLSKQIATKLMEDLPPNSGHKGGLRDLN